MNKFKMKKTADTIFADRQPLKKSGAEFVKKAQIEDDNIGKTLYDDN